MSNDSNPTPAFPWRHLDRESRHTHSRGAPTVHALTTAAARATSAQATCGDLIQTLHAVLEVVGDRAFNPEQDGPGLDISQPITLSPDDRERLRRLLDASLGMAARSRESFEVVVCLLTGTPIPS